jgi:carbon monoxide dehydrogenase subunit G
MIIVEQQHQLNVSQEQVFEYLSQPENDSEWQAACKEVRRDPGTVGVGCRYAIWFSFLGREMVFENEIVEFQPYKRFAYRTLSGPIHFRGQYRFEAVETGTRIHWAFEADPGRFFGILPQSVLKKVLAKQVHSDLLRLEKLLTADCSPQPA